MTVQRSIQEENSMGRFSRSWDLVGESFSILWADKQLMLFPVLSGISCMIVTLLLGAGGLAVFLPAIREAGITPQNVQHSGRSAEFMAAMFVFYLANYFVIVFFNVALVGVANSRLTGGSWTFDQGLQLAWKRKWVILQWAFVAGTAGMVVGMVAGVAWVHGVSVIRVSALSLRVRSGRPAGLFKRPDRVGLESERLRTFSKQQDDGLALEVEPAQGLSTALARP